MTQEACRVPQGILLEMFGVFIIYPYLCPQKNKKTGRINMSTTALSGLLEYLYSTLSISNMRWVGEHLIEHAKKEEVAQLRPYTMEEIHERLDQSRREVLAGLSQDSEEMFRELEEEFAREENLLMDEAV